MWYTILLTLYTCFTLYPFIHICLTNPCSVNVSGHFSESHVYHKSSIPLRVRQMALERVKSQRWPTSLWNLYIPTAYIINASHIRVTHIFKRCTNYIKWNLTLPAWKMWHFFFVELHELSFSSIKIHHSTYQQK